MSKTKTKKRTTASTEVDPRIRMKEMRNIVADAHNQGKRIDLMNFIGDDLIRSQIVLQDMLTKEQEKHSKARNHIIKYRNSIKTLISNTKGKEVYIKALHSEQELNSMADNAIAELMIENEQLKIDLETTMNSLRIALNGSTNG